ncbi:MAG TPA: GTPase [Marmoricola sp.]|jgi:GTP-binding protein EngB required for normal cell division|nr:GTPase [Marmoricola sp.]
MTSVLDGDDKMVTRGTDIGVRVKGLDAALSAARGRLDEATLAPVADLVGRASERLRLSADHTVVALGGATGSGKSSTFNALVGLDLASVGVRRPTTSWASACTWGTNGAAELLEWLGIPQRHQVVRDSMLDTGRETREMDGLVLLDMPDHDSTEVAHHLEVERLVRLADLLIWVLDPQKYADAAIHDRFLQPLAAHTGVMMIVLNHIDEVAEDRRAGMVADLRRLLDADGLDGITVIAVSAREGIGIEDLRRAITQRVADKAATKARIATSLAEVGAAMSHANGEAQPPALNDRDLSGLRGAMAEAAGVPQVVAAVEKASLLRTRRATGWPVTSWMSRLGRDPLRNIDLSASTRQLVKQARVSLPDSNQVQTARVDTAVREVADRMSAGLTRPWATSIRRVATSRLPEINERLDRAVSATDLAAGKVPFWTRAVSALQWLLLLVAVGGGLWWAGAEYATSLNLSEPKIGGVPVPALVLGGGILLGLLLAVGCGSLVDRNAKARAREADVRLRKAVDAVTEELVVLPVKAELDAYRLTVEGLSTALR